MWITAPELAGLPGMPTSQRHVLRIAQAEQWTARPRPGRGRSGFEYLVTDLPEATQQALAAGAASSRAPTAAVDDPCTASPTPQRKTRSDRGQSRLAADEELHQVFVAALYELRAPTVRQLQRVIASSLGEARTPSLSTLKRWLREYRNKPANGIALLNLEGRDASRTKYIPTFADRGEAITTPNAEWHIDATLAQAGQRVEVAFNLTDRDTGEIRRHVAVAVIDAFTRQAKVLLTRTCTANAVKAITRSAMLAWGQPTCVKTHGGADYTAGDYSFVLQTLKVQHVPYGPYNVRERPFIDGLLSDLLNDLFPVLQGFAGRDVADAVASGRSFAECFGETGVDLRMSPEQLQGAIKDWLEAYHARRHDELGCSPNEMAERHATHVVRVDARALDLFMVPVANGTRTVGKRGISMPLHDAVGTAWYRAPELAAVDVMGQQVYCRIDEADVGALHVFRLDGGYICRALDHARLGINRGELAAKARAIESATVKPLVDAYRKSKRKGLVAGAVRSIYEDRQKTAVSSALNVTRLAPRQVQHSTPATASVLALGNGQTAQDTARAAARAALSEEAPTVRMDTAKQRYSAWVRLTSGADAGQQLASRDVAWMHSYQDSTEFSAWHVLHGGNDPLSD